MATLTKIIIALCFLSFFALCSANTFSPQATYEVCFTPQQNCTQLLVDLIKQAQKKILLQAYSFTSAPIARALIQAKHRGVDVEIIFDKSHAADSYLSPDYFAEHGIEPRIDYTMAIAHNKVLIVDDEIVATGSFNFTKAAQADNAENLLIIVDSKVAKEYIKNWNKRYSLSAELGSYENSLRSHFSR